MISRSRNLLSVLLAVCALSAQSAPTVYPTGTTLYQPDRSWNGYTVLSILDTPAVIVIDMNGRVVKQWNGFNLGPGGPARVLPDGEVIASAGAYPGHQEATDLLHMDFDGREQWRFNRNEQINVNGETRWSTRQHHDWQRSDFPAGYYSPQYPVQTDGVRTLLLTHTNYQNPAVADVMLEDDRLIEISETGELLWQWRSGDHIGEFDFSPQERQSIHSAPGVGNIPGGSRGYDWLHINSATYLGPNRWYAAGDDRFHPDNVIVSSRQSSIVAIIARDGSVVWQIGPDFSRSPQLRELGQIIGQHHAHMIPQGLPGAGNIMIFDNGGSSGYGAPSPIALNGLGIYARATSRVLEIDPLSLELLWSYRAPNFFSTNISGAQRLPNGNTLITEGAPGRVFEVTGEGDIVWEYMNAPSPYGRGSNAVYRAYRIPYDWLPQLAQPDEREVRPPEPGSFTVP